MSRYWLTKAADADLDIIFWQGLERFGPSRTERYVEELERTFDHLCRFPEAARLRTELTPPVRAYPLEAHVIIYEIENGGIAILRIRSGRENWTASPLEDDE
ncbi:type II toxin-antitoxin system RelE/ParE family toxin [Brevundimonas sp.]